MKNIIFLNFFGKVSYFFHFILLNRLNISDQCERSDKLAIFRTSSVLYLCIPKVLV